jgi:co-chaperonin GroES (HSP10)
VTSASTHGALVEGKVVGSNPTFCFTTLERSADVKKGDIVVFSTGYGTYEGKIIKVYDKEYIKIRYWKYGIVPVHSIDRINRMHTHIERSDAK